METPLEVPFPSPMSAPHGRSLLRFIHDRNPFFLLSALSMFAGFRIVLAAVDSAPGDLKHLLLLIVTLNVYEALILALGLFLIVRRGLVRDGWILLTIEAMFLVDLTNLNAEFFTANQRWGSMVNGVCFVLAMAKILIVVRILGLRLSAGTLFYIAAQMAFLLGMPGMFKMMTYHARISPMQIYGIWWMAALLIVGGSFLVKRPIRGSNSPMAVLPWRLYILIPLISLIVHLCGENRVYWVHFQPANFAPLLLAFVVLLNRAKWSRRHSATVGWSMLLIAIAVLVSIMPQEDHLLLSRHLAGLAISPLRLAMFASAAILGWLYFLHGSKLALCAAAISVTLGCLGTNPAQMTLNSDRLVHWAAQLLKHGIPSTPLQWGYAAIAVSFLLLGVGAAVSLRKTHSLTPPVRADLE